MRDCLAKHPDDRPASADELLKRYEIGLGKRFILPRRSGLVPTVRAAVAAKASSGPETPPPIKQLTTAADLLAVRHSMEVRMPESMALLKIKGFIHDLGGKVMDSVPGLIHVRLAEPREQKKTSLFGWTDRTDRRLVLQTAPSSTDIELHMERPDPSQPGRLVVTLIMRPADGAATPEWKSRCRQISRDLQAYLMGR